MNHLPRISVVIPFFNRGELIEETVRSAVAQEGPFELLEVLVVDDKSDEPRSFVRARTPRGSPGRVGTPQPWAERPRSGPQRRHSRGEGGVDCLSRF